MYLAGNKWLGTLFLLVSFYSVFQIVVAVNDFRNSEELAELMLQIDNMRDLSLGYKNSSPCDISEDSYDCKIYRYGEGRHEHAREIDKKDRYQEEIESAATKRYITFSIILCLGLYFSYLGLLTNKVIKTKKCPYCAEEIKIDANICKHCGKELTTVT